jgi:hypothetical protein
MTGNAYSGETGSTTVTNGNLSTITASNVTLAAILAAKKKLDDKDVEMEDRYFLTSTQVMNSLLANTQATSSDYVTVKALIRGEIDTWLGFKWIMSTRTDATNHAIAYQKYGVCLAMADAPLVRTDERSDLSYSWQVYYELNIGATRLEEDRVCLLRTG